MIKTAFHVKIINIQRAQILQQKIKKLLNPQEQPKQENTKQENTKQEPVKQENTKQENSKQNNQTTNNKQEQTKPQTTAKETKKNTNTVVKKETKNKVKNYLIQHQTVLQ